MRRELAIEFSRVTEAAALAGYKWLGRGDKNTADGAAVLTAELQRLRLWSDGMAALDGNGIATDNQVTPDALAGAIELGLQRDDLRAVITGLPVGAVEENPVSHINLTPTILEWMCFLSSQRSMLVRMAESSPGSSSGNAPRQAGNGGSASYTRLFSTRKVIPDSSRR